LEHLLSDQSYGLVFKVESSSGLIGYAVLCFGYSVELGGRDVFLDDFYIIPSERGQGLGHTVMKVFS
jgi:GNAT superfamily N-acetyltransferase